MDRSEHAPNNAQIVASLVTLATGWDEILVALPASDSDAPKPRKRRNTATGKRSK